MSDSRAIKVIKVKARDLKEGDIYRRITGRGDWITGRSDFNRDWHEVTSVEVKGQLVMVGSKTHNKREFRPIDLVEVQVPA